MDGDQLTHIILYNTLFRNFKRYLHSLLIRHKASLPIITQHYCMAPIDIKLDNKLSDKITIIDDIQLIYVTDESTMSALDWKLVGRQFDDIPPRDCIIVYQLYKYGYNKGHMAVGLKVNNRIIYVDPYIGSPENIDKSSAKYITKIINNCTSYNATATFESMQRIDSIKNRCACWVMYLAYIMATNIAEPLTALNILYNDKHIVDKLDEFLLCEYNETYESSFKHNKLILTEIIDDIKKSIINNPIEQSTYNQLLNIIQEYNPRYLQDIIYLKHISKLILKASVDKKYTILEIIKSVIESDHLARISCLLRLIE